MIYLFVNLSNLFFISGYIEQLTCKTPEDFMTSSQASLIRSEHTIAPICMPVLCVWDSFFPLLTWRSVLRISRRGHLTREVFSEALDCIFAPSNSIWLELCFCRWQTKLIFWLTFTLTENFYVYFDICFSICMLDRRYIILSLFISETELHKVLS